VVHPPDEVYRTADEPTTTLKKSYTLREIVA
jgi:hypothetical protein